MDVTDLQQKIVASDQVEDMINQPGWQNYIKPLLDAMIIDVLGGQVEGQWFPGALDEKDLSAEKLRALQEYKRALIDFSSRINLFLQEGEAAKVEIQAYNEDQLEKYTTPMINDTQYGD